MRLAVPSIVLFLAACFTEPPADRVWRCSADKPLCPSGQTCVTDWCVQDGTAMPDLSISDSGGGDMTLRPCADGFPIGTQGVWACRGKFSATTTKASTLCQNRYKVCADGNKLTDAECSAMTLSAFFFAEAPATGPTGTGAKCATGTGPGWGGMWFGCGSTPTGSGGPKSERTATPCRGFPIVSYCDNRNLFFCDLNDGRLDAQRNDEPRNGVLCCPP